MPESRSDHHFNIFFSYGSASSKNKKEDLDDKYQRQLENNLTRAFMIVMKHLSSEQRELFLKKLITEIEYKDNNPEFGLLNWPSDLNKNNFLICVSDFKKGTADNATDKTSKTKATADNTTDKTSVPDAWIKTAEMNLVFEFKSPGEKLCAEQIKKHYEKLKIEDKKVIYISWKDLFDNLGGLDTKDRKQEFLKEECLNYYDAEGIGEFQNFKMLSLLLEDAYKEYDKNKELDDFRSYRTLRILIRKQLYRLAQKVVDDKNSEFNIVSKDSSKIHKVVKLGKLTDGDTYFVLKIPNKEITISVGVDPTESQENIFISLYSASSYIIYQKNCVPEQKAKYAKNNYAKWTSLIEKMIENLNSIKYNNISNKLKFSLYALKLKSGTWRDGGMAVSAEEMKKYLNLDFEAFKNRFNEIFEEQRENKIFEKFFFPFKEDDIHNSGPEEYRKPAIAISLNIPINEELQFKDFIEYLKGFSSLA